MLDYLGYLLSQVAEYLQRMTERPAWVRAQREQLKDEDRGETRAL